MASRKYKNPPIEEALCEFTFLMDMPPQIDFTLPGKLVNHPNTKQYLGPTRTQNIQTVMGPLNAPPMAFHDTIFRIQMPTVDGKRLLSIGPDTVSVSVFRPYEGWEQFRPRIEGALHAYSETTGRTVARRVGIRYVNRIVVPTANADASLYLAEMNGTHETLGRLQNSFMHKGEYLREDGFRVIVTQATLQSTALDTTEFLVDVDTLWDAGFIDGIPGMMAKVEELHSIEGAAFESLITDKSREIFDAA